MAQINNKQSIDISFSNHSLSVFVLLQGENDGLLPQEYEHFGLMRQREKFTLFPFFSSFFLFLNSIVFSFPLSLSTSLSSAPFSFIGSIMEMPAFGVAERPAPQKLHLEE